MNILGISAYYHDSAAALVRDGQIVAAAQEERFTRKKHDHRFPKEAVRACLDIGGISVKEVDYVVFYDKPLLKFERLLETYLQFAPKGITSFMQAMPLWIGEKLWIPDLVAKELDYEGKVLFTKHHQSHAASAFYPSPFEEAAFLTIDGVGEWSTTSYGFGKGRELEIIAEIMFPHSLGLLYSAFTYFTGFRVNSGEYKLMGLAPYGEPKYVSAIYEHLIDVKEDGSFAMNMDYFDYCAGLTMTNEKFAGLFNGPARSPESKLTQREMDLAASIQVVTEEIVIKIARHIREATGRKNLCMAGGVALNCVANGKLLREGIFDDIWIQPAAGDAGGALGAALAAYHLHLGQPRAVASDGNFQRGSYVGREYSHARIETFLKETGAPFESPSEDEFMPTVARLLAEGNVVGWFRGRSEFGPRALGGRSILGDARNVEMQKKLNLKIKYRESFRPFAPSILEEEVSNWFNLDRESPYMLLVADVVPDKQIAMNDAQKNLWGIDKLNVARSSIPAVTHVDYSARVQTVRKEHNAAYHALIRAFADLTGVPVIVNTSFNVRSEPIVETPEEAYRCFMRTDMDVLVLENFILHKAAQPKFEETVDWRSEYELD